MIRLGDGRQYGTAAEIARELGADVTATMIRNWARRDGLEKFRVGAMIYFRLIDAAIIEAAKRATKRGRTRRVDGQPRSVA